eukprot:g31290.t1
MLHFAIEALRVSLKHFLCPPAISELGVEHQLGESRVGHVDDVPSPSRVGSASMLAMLAWWRKLVLVYLSSQQIRNILHRQRWWYCFSTLRCLPVDVSEPYRRAGTTTALYTMSSVLDLMLLSLNTLSLRRPKAALAHWRESLDVLINFPSMHAYRRAQ